MTIKDYQRLSKTIKDYRWNLSSHKSATFLDSLAGPYSMLANKFDTLGSVTRRIVSIASTEVGGTPLTGS